MEKMVEQGTYKLVNVCEIETNIEFKKRGLVILNRTNHKVWTIQAKARNTDMRSVVKYLAKAYLADERRTYLANQSSATKNSNCKERNFVSAALSGDVLMVTDQHGCIMQNSRVYAEESLRKSFGVRKSHRIYKLVVEDGLEWSNEDVIFHLNEWVQATMEHLSARTRSNEAIESAANHTEQEELKEQTTVEVSVMEVPATKHVLSDEEKAAKRREAARKAAITRARNKAARERNAA